MSTYKMKTCGSEVHTNANILACSSCRKSETRMLKFSNTVLRNMKIVLKLQFQTTFSVGPMYKTNNIIVYSYIIWKSKRRHGQLCRWVDGVQFIFNLSDLMFFFDIGITTERNHLPLTVPSINRTTNRINDLSIHSPLDDAAAAQKLPEDSII